MRMCYAMLQNKTSTSPQQIIHPPLDARILGIRNKWNGQVRWEIEGEMKRYFWVFQCELYKWTEIKSRGRKKPSEKGEDWKRINERGDRWSYKYHQWTSCKCNRHCFVSLIVMGRMKRSSVRAKSRRSKTKKDRHPKHLDSLSNASSIPPWYTRLGNSPVGGNCSVAWRRHLVVLRGF